MTSKQTEGTTEMAKRNTARKVEMVEMTTANIDDNEHIESILGDQISEMEDSVGVINGIANQVEPIQLDEKGRKKEVRMSMEQLEALGLKNKSQMIRYLIAEGHSPSATAKFMGVIYQHVRNVMFQQLKRPAPELKVPESTEETEE